MPLPEGLLLSYYGDDFTGSTDTMEALAKVGIRTALFLEPPTPAQLRRFAGLRAVGVAGVSRSLTPMEMDAELPLIFARLKALSAPLFHVKICSTFDSAPHIGSIGHTIEIGQRIFASPFVPLVVGAPILNRYCVFGNLFARSGPESAVFRLDRHPTMTRHPITPMEESDLRLHLARQTTRSIGLVDVLDLEASPEHCAERVEALREEKSEILLFDTLTNRHLEVIGRLLWERSTQSPPLFVVGSSGVEYALAAHWQQQGVLPAPPCLPAEPVEQIIVVSGSCSPVTAKQIAWATENGFTEVALDPVALLKSAGDSGEVWKQTLDSALMALEQGRSVILHTCAGPEDPRLTATTRYFERSGAQESGRDLGRLLGRLLRDLLTRSRVRRAVVAGGDTSGYAAREMGITALETVTPMAPGSPLCRVHAESPLDGLEILFKGGQVGRIDLFGSILKGTV